jgi:hypothetical protein
MNKINGILTALLVSILIWTSNSFAALEDTKPVINVEGLTLDEAENKYGVASGIEHPIIFEVNAESGQRDCGLILATGGGDACPAAKIFYQSTKVIPNYDGTTTMKVDVYYDVNQVVIKKG